ncbi:hypothetical protein F5X68DRAFT_71951 [Plectosphaerella plurivora]|uniref:Uncharacterized protein n=1 Tax=Plectosphaerella plurivora TaxID=936078 RepID=A0A9P9AAI0_9PEZI|nr:hypothetical protein F5X68DRAFT_71951 [Plectosphaerella plurivora]
MTTTPRMAPAFIATTPPPPPSSSIRTPPTPKHGFSDHWEPYSPRKSARIASRQPTTTTTTSSTAHRTPSPQSSRRNRTPTRISTRKTNATGASIMSPTQTPQKKRFPAAASSSSAANASSSVPSHLPTEGTMNAAHALGLDKNVDTRTTSVNRRSGMLPTPVKTPKKAPTEAQAASIRAVARNLFYEGEASTTTTTTTTVTKTPRKPRVPKRYNGISMESFVAEEVEDPISIYTDSQDRVPAVDSRAENPFYSTRAATTNAAPAQPPRRRSKRAAVTVPGEGSLHIDEALQREDGMVCVFRGKRIFRKFAVNVDDEDVNSEEESLRMPLTRSSIQPRRLFQKALPEISPEDEEAATDIDEEYLDEMESKEEEEVPQTPIVDKSEHATPSAPRFPPAPTPPETRRSTRFGVKGEDATPSSKPKSGRLFDNWPITKSRSSSSEQSHKRAADDTVAEPSAKRSRV